MKAVTQAGEKGPRSTSSRGRAKRSFLLTSPTPSVLSRPTKRARCEPGCGSWTISGRKSSLEIAAAS